MGVVFTGSLMSNLTSENQLEVTYPEKSHGRGKTSIQDNVDNFLK